MELTNDILMELMDREREHGRMLHVYEALTDLMNQRIAEALHDDEIHEFYHNYENLEGVKVTIGDIALVTGYNIPSWLMRKAEQVKKMREGES